MKANFKPLGLAAAVAAATAGYAGVAAAQERAVGGIGDLAIVPYYTVVGDFVTGVHITNTSASTQVVKIRLRRASDSMDALDFNLIMSPYDVWTGFLDDSSGSIVFKTDDNTCTAPLRENGTFEMPPLYSEGAEEGYIEIIAMAQAEDEGEPIAIAAEHGSDGVPFDCELVAQNFFADGAVGDYGWRAPDETEQEWWEDSSDIGDYDLIDDGFSNYYEDSDNALRVSFFIRDASSGLEFGSEAVHIADFADEPMMTNQESGLFSGDITGFDYPDLNGGLFGYQVRDKFDTIIRPLLGSEVVINDWSNNSALNVSTDWVVTLPGQYTMLDYYLYNAQIFYDLECGGEHPDDADVDVPECDFRDLPAKVTFDVTRDREEYQPRPDEGDLVVSPSIPGVRPTTEFRYEVNVIEWTDGSNDSVLDSSYAISVDTSAYPQPYGWAALSVTENNSNDQQVCLFPVNQPGASKLDPELSVAGDFNDLLWYDNCVALENPQIPMVGFVAWERSFPSDPSANYGRIIDHAFVTSAD